MDWEEIVNTICDLVKDIELRRQIYDRLLENTHIDEEDVRMALDIDRVFDEVVKNYIEDQEIIEDDDYNYDYEEE